MMFWKKSKESPFVFTSEFDIMREQREEDRKRKAKEDEYAVQRSLSYEPPVRVVKGKYNDFLEVGSLFGPKACVPLHLIAATSIRYDTASIRYYSPMNSPSDIAFLVIEMLSGSKHSVKVEVASAELLLEAVNKVWRAPA